MKKFLPLLLLAIFTGTLYSQTGTGVVLQGSDSFTFPPTTLNESMTKEIYLVNTVGVDQDVTFSGLDAPFSLQNSHIENISTQDSILVIIEFSPTELGTFEDVLNITGSVFGDASLNLSGDGIQVQLTWSTETVDFGVTALGAVSNQSISLSSVGDGDAEISDIVFSNSAFTVDSTNSDFTIPEGGSGEINFLFSPVVAGQYSETVTLHTNDPNNSEILIHLDGIGISEVSGELCDVVWTTENSPYTLVGDIIVPEDCYVYVQKGVTVIGHDYNIEVHGSFMTFGTDSEGVIMDVGEFISHAESENVQLHYTDLTETNEFEFTDADYRLIRDQNIYSQDSLAYYFDYLVDYSYLYDNENASNHIGKYVEDFSDNNGQGWTHNGNYHSHSENQEYLVNYVWGSNSNTWYNIYIETPTFDLNLGEYPSSITFDAACYYWSYTHYLYTEISVDGGGWQQIQSVTNPSTSYASYDVSLSLNDASTVKFRFHHNMRYGGELKIDNFVLTTSFYPSEDIPFSSSYGTNLLSTGGIEFSNSTFTGDYHSVNDTLNIVLENSQIIANDDREKDSHGLGLYADHVNITSTNSTISGHALDGIHIETTTSNLDLTDHNTNDNGEDGIYVNGDLDLQSTECSYEGNGEDAVEAGENSNMTFMGCSISNNGSRGVAAEDYSVVDMDYLFIDDNSSDGIDLEDGGALYMNNSRLRGNGGAGIASGSPVNVDYCDIAFSGGTGLVLTDNNFHTLNNSILWGNNSSNYTQINISGGVISTSYSTVQGRSSYGTSGSGQYYWGEGVIEADPLFADDDLHLETFSPCVDGGQPWHQDTNMPFGLGGVRADMGIYGGPDNAYWGGDALPDGSCVLTSVTDSPQDQGGVVGVVFDASFYDNSDLVNNVTHYAFWRHYDPTGSEISTLDEGSWELVGEMPALDFNGYAYQAQTLGNTNTFGTFNSCYTVVAHTDDDDTYWYSNVVCGESIDNLAPGDPDIEGLVLTSGDIQIMWQSPLEEDYAYTEVTSDSGFTTDVVGDTLSVDDTVELGGLITYTVVHYDVNGNASNPASISFETAEGYDEIVLHAGWNLISTDRIPYSANVEDAFSSLAEGNLEYVTGFNMGLEFYDPNGLEFLNSLSAISNGYGYWVKVEEDDVLIVNGATISQDYMPPLNEGWNLVGHMNSNDIAPEVVFEDLYANGDLIYVIGFDQGTQVYDPNGLPFLNTLTDMRNGFGYWVKSAAATDGGVLAPIADDDIAAVANPRYAVLNGTSNLKEFAGEYVDVMNARGHAVARLEILPGGYLMTTAVYEDDANGLREGDALRFRFRGSVVELADESFKGEMEHVKLNLNFPDLEASLSIFPNPLAETATINYTLLEKGVVLVELLDVQGRVLEVVEQGSRAEGAQTVEFNASDLAAGSYSIRLSVDGREIANERIVKSK